MGKLFIVAIEGLDKSGKATQTRMLANALREKGLNVEQGEFHRYDTPTGELIAKWLRKEYEVSQETIELIMAADKQAQQGKFIELEEAGVEVLILDRYTMSQLVYAAANEVSLPWSVDLQEQMRKPDLNIVIDIPATVSMERKGKHNGGVNDRYESDLELLKKVRLLYKIMDYKAPVIDGMKSIDEIHKDILTIVMDRMADK